MKKEQLKHKVKWRDKVEEIKKNIYLLYLALKHKEVPWYSKVIITLVVGYALSPIDLIPDFIPVFGYLDDLILLPLGIILALKTIPPDVVKELKQESIKELKKESRIGAVVIIFIWVLVIGFILYSQILYK